MRLTNDNIHLNIYVNENITMEHTDDEVIVYVETTHKICILNHTATLLLGILTEKFEDDLSEVSVDDICNDFFKLFNFDDDNMGSNSYDIIRQDVIEMIEEFISNGIL